jgi:hypothetical protein
LYSGQDICPKLFGDNRALCLQPIQQEFRKKSTQRKKDKVNIVNTNIQGIWVQEIGELFVFFLQFLFKSEIMFKKKVTTKKDPFVPMV